MPPSLYRACASLRTRLAAVFCVSFVFFFFNDTATTEIYTLSLHDALPIYVCPDRQFRRKVVGLERDVHDVVGRRVGPERPFAADCASALGEPDDMPAQVCRYAVVVARQTASLESFLPLVLVGKTGLADGLAQEQREVAVADGPAADEVHGLAVAKTPVAGRSVEFFVVAVEHFEADGVQQAHHTARGLMRSAER